MSGIHPCWAENTDIRGDRSTSSETKRSKETVAVLLELAKTPAAAR